MQQCSKNKVNENEINFFARNKTVDCPEKYQDGMLLQIVFQETPKWHQALRDDTLTKVSEPGRYLQIQMRVHSVF